MNMKCQRGELSLFWAAVLVGVVTLGAVAALLSTRHERNLVGDTWQRIKQADAGKNLQRTTEQAVKSESASIRKCLVGGKVVYSNVECDAGNPTSRQVELHDTQGIESPKALPAPPSTQAAGVETLQEKMIDKAVQR